MRRVSRAGLLAATIVALVVPSVAGAANRTVLISRPDGTGPVPPAFDNGSKLPGAVSADGRYVAFTSEADGFAPGVNPRVTNVFLRDTQRHTTILVSRSDGMNGVGANESAADPATAVGSDGHVFVAFVTTASNLSDHVTGPEPNPTGSAQVWLRDLTAGTTSLVSRAGATGAAGTADSQQPAIDVTAGGPVVVFGTNALNLGPPDGGLILRTIDAGTNELVSCVNRDCSGNPHSPIVSAWDVRVVSSVAGRALCAPPTFTAPCVLVAFSTTDPSITQDRDGQGQIVVAQATAPATVGAATGQFGTFAPATAGNALSDRPVFNSDGRALAFVSSATDLSDTPVPADTVEAYVHSFDVGNNVLVSQGTRPANADVDAVALGGDASHLRAVFATGATNLGASGPELSQVYLRDLAQRTTSILGRASGPHGALGNFGALGPPAISADGSAAIFSSFSTNLGDDPSGRAFPRVHLRRLSTLGQQNELISRPSGTGPFLSGVQGGSVSAGRSASADGRFVVFTSASPSLSSANRSGAEDVFVRDVLTGRTILVSRANGVRGAVGNGDSFLGSISADGRRVAFESDAGNLTPDSTPTRNQVYVRDLVTNTTTLVSRATGVHGRPASTNAFPHGISADGNAVLIRTAAALDRAGAGGQFHLYERDLRTNTTTLVDRDTGAAGAVAKSGVLSASLDGNGGRVAWSTFASLAGAPDDGHSHVYVRDLRAGTTTLVSRGDGSAGSSADGSSGDPSIDAAGDAVAFVSAAPSLGVTPQLGQEVFLRAGTRTQLASVGTEGGALIQAEQPSIDGSGRHVAFAGHLVAGDTEEVFLRDLSAGTSSLASRADGPLGAPSDGDAIQPSVSTNGRCVVFEAAALNLNDGFASADFLAVHMRSVSGDCPRAASPPPPPVRVAMTKLATTSRGIAFTLSRPARVTLRFQRLLRGHRRGGRCRRGGHGPGCTLVVRAGRVIVQGRAGANRVGFPGHGLKPGRYRLTASPTGGRAHTITFRV